MFLVGILLNEPHMPDFNYRQVFYSICYVKCLPLLWFLTSYFISRNQTGKRKVCQCWEGYVDHVKDPECLEAMPIYVSISCIMP